MRARRAPPPAGAAAPSPDPSVPSADPGRHGFCVGSASHVGCVRQINEDRCFVAADLGIFAVADGMGGHEAGEIASAAIVEALASIGRAVSAADLLARLEDRVVRANAAVHALGQRRGGTIGSTLAVLLAYEGDFACLWSGDSRVYRIRDGAIRQLSRDHTEALALLEQGLLSPEQARTWPRRNVITQAIGVRAEPELEIEHGVLQPGDRFVLCSDGLTGHVEDHEILDLTLASEPQVACDALVALTLERGARDNVTVVIAHHRSAAPRENTVLLPRAEEARDGVRDAARPA